MFRLEPNPSFWARVALSIPGKEKPAYIEIEFKHKSRENLKEFLESLSDRDDLEALSEIITNWKGVDADFSRENLSEMLANYPKAAHEIFSVYHEEMLEARRKN